MDDIIGMFLLCEARNIFNGIILILYLLIVDPPLIFRYSNLDKK